MKLKSVAMPPTIKIQNTPGDKIHRKTSSPTNHLLMDKLPEDDMLHDMLNNEPDDDNEIDPDNFMKVRPNPQSA